MIFDFDDFGANHVISDQCQSHDCRDALQMLKEANPDFKVTLFTVPWYMTMEMAYWAQDNHGWVELAQHGFTHDSNYECEEISFLDMEGQMEDVGRVWGGLFVKGFKAPGWQISDDAFRWLKDNGWWVADQPYNDDRRPEGLPVYKIGDNSVHGHTWDCVGNGIYETLSQLLDKVKTVDEFKFVSEALS